MTAPVGSQFGPRTSSKATTALVFALLGLVMCGPIGAVIALVVASGADREIRASGGSVTGEGLVTAARVIAYVGLAIWVLLVVAGAVRAVVR